MAIWEGDVWVCEQETCRTVNMILRKHCRSCGVGYPGPVHPDPEINREIQRNMVAAVVMDSAAR
jgi:hypothetical protein